MSSSFLSVLGVVVFALVYIVLGDIGRELRLGASAVSAFFTVLWAYYVTLSDFYGEFSLSLFSYFFDDIFVFSTILILFSVAMFIVRVFVNIAGRRGHG